MSKLKDKSLKMNLFYINYEECKLIEFVKVHKKETSFILTMRNVNGTAGAFKFGSKTFYINYEECKF